MEDIPAVERDARDRPDRPPGEGDDWSIEDFDDFAEFDGLDLGDHSDPQSQLDFGETPDVADPVTGSPLDDDEPDRAPEPDHEPAAEPVMDTTDDSATDDSASDDSASDDLQEDHDDLPPESTEETEPPFEPETEPPTSETVPAEIEAAAFEPEEESPFTFEAPSEPEAAMARPAPSTESAAAPESTDAVFDVEEVPDFSSFTQEQYVQATTQEYAGLAEEVARAAAEEPEPMAISAGIPGLETGVVGLDDVVGDESDTVAPAPPRSGSDLSVRVLTAVALISLFFASLLQDYLVATLIFVVMMIAATELYVVLTRAGHRPMTLIGLVGIGFAQYGAFQWGTRAIVISLSLTTVATLVYFGVIAHRREPLLDAGLTLLGVGWIGGLGSLAMDIAFAEDFAWMIAAVVIITALMDVAQYFVGRRFGRRPLAPRVSPKKTVEGLIGGVVTAIGVGAALGAISVVTLDRMAIDGPFDVWDGLLIGAIVAVVGPLGDLAVSVVKRAIGVKDMGAILPGHGGVLDRIDAMIFVIPAAWVAYNWMGLIAP